MLFWISLLMLSLITYALLMVWVLPKLMLKIEYPLSHPTDRGLKKYAIGDSDYAIVYEPSLKARDYITQYVIAKQGDEKIFTCKLSQNVVYIDYDVVLFDANETCFQVINSKDISYGDGKCPQIVLPKETSYASVIVNQVNEKELNESSKTRVAPGRIALFGILCLILSIGMSIASLFTFSNIFGGLFKETFAAKMFSSGWIFIFPTLICVVCITIACYVLFSNYSQKNSKR